MNADEAHEHIQRRIEARFARVHAEMNQLLDRFLLLNEGDPVIIPLSHIPGYDPVDNPKPRYAFEALLAIVKERNENSKEYKFNVQTCDTGMWVDIAQK